MSQLELDLFKQRIADRYDPDYLVDVLDISSEELLEAFSERLAEKRSAFSEVDEEDDGNDE